MAKKQLTFELNGKTVEVEVNPETLLLDVLREDLKLTGTKRGCGNGECGACTVLVDGEPITSCIYPALKVQGKKVLTVEGLGKEGKLHPLQKNFLSEGAVQCGFCTPGMLLTAKALLDKTPRPTEKEIHEAISGNLCRCTGYKKIVQAIDKTASEVYTGAVSGAEKERDKQAGPGAIGKSIARKEGVSKVLGRSKFAADLHFPGMLHAKVLRSAYPHALLKGIDTGRARNIPGVEAVLTAEDVPGTNSVGYIIKDQQVFAKDKVRFMGEPLAVVAATTEKIAEEALKEIVVDYEPLPVLSTPEEALADKAPLIHDQGNVLLTRKVRRGDPEKAFKQAYIIVEDTFKTQMVEHAYIEPEAGVALIEDDIVVVYAVSQGVHYHQEEIAAVLNLPLNKVRTIQTTTGGAFGGKVDLNVHVYVALLAQKTGLPVKMVYSREESIVASTKRHPFTMTYKMGADREGKLIAAEITMIADTGAYASYGPATLTRAVTLAVGPYVVPNIKIDACAVYTNNLICGAMRGFGVPQIAVAHEGMMDRLAGELGISPLEMRRRNIYKEGSVSSSGQTLKAVGIGRTLEAAVQETDNLGGESM
ncbi:MAG: molybdopterin-dependent oxidoreductase [Firmicutes bacterium]|mgnify:CR=1 FL=1|nr:molybdopterin-dependent oxidoreductase [Bacillota bacterium]